MASKSYPRYAYNNGALTELEHERLVQAQAPDGLLGNPTGPALVYADGAGVLTVRVRANQFGLFRGSLYDSGDVDIPLELEPNTSGATRLDLVVLRLTRSDYRIVEDLRTGVPGAGVPAPVMDLGATGVWEFPAAEVTVINGAVNLAPATVKNRAWYVGEDGQLVCTSTSRPPHAVARRIREIDTNRTLESDGSKWTVLLEDTGWVTGSLASGWSGAGVVARRKNGWVSMSVSCQRTGSAIGASAYSTIATLPTSYRPNDQRYNITAVVSSPDSVRDGYIDTNGAVVLRPNYSQGINQDAFVFSSATFPIPDAA